MNEEDLAFVRTQFAALLAKWQDIPVGSKSEQFIVAAPGVRLSLRIWRKLAKVVADL